MDFNLGSAFSSFTRTLDTLGHVNFPGRSSIENVIAGGTSTEALLGAGASALLNKAGINRPASAFGLGKFASHSSGPLNSSGPLSKAQARPDPIMSWRWEAHVPGLPLEYIEDIVIPLPTFEVEPTFRGGSKTYYAKFVDHAAFQMRLYTDLENTAIDWLYKCYGSIRNSDGTYNYPNQYKFAIDVNLLDPHNKVACSFKLVGCFPISGTGYEMQSAASDRVVLSVEMSIDTVELQTSKSNASMSKAFSIPTAVPQLNNLAGFAAPLTQGADTLINTLGNKASSFLSAPSFSGFR